MILCRLGFAGFWEIRAKSNIDNCVGCLIFWSALFDSTRIGLWNQMQLPRVTLILVLTESF